MEHKMSTTDEQRPISYGRRLSTLADQHPDKVAIYWEKQTGDTEALSWAWLDKQSNRLVRLAQHYGVKEKTVLVVGLPNCPLHFVAVLAGWKAGALVVPLRAALPAWERDQILAVAKPTLVIADWDDVSYPILHSGALAALDQFSDEPLPDCIPQPGKAIASGGSTGRPKIIVDPRPWATVPGRNYFGYYTGYRPGQVQLVAGPLYHNSPFGWSHSGLFDDHSLVLMERFDAARAAELIERYRVNFAYLAPTMMARIARLPDIQQRDLSSIEAIYHTSAPCPVWLKQAWIDLIGPEKLYEGYGTTEGIGSARIRGDEWLKHQGSVGRPHNSALKILRDDGSEAATGEIGEIYMRRTDTSEPTYFYIGSEPLKQTPDSYSTAGDMGWVDADGYLYIADRRTDLIITGGANVYPAEVEGVLSAHPQVEDVVIIGLPDDEWGRRVHAVIQPVDRSQPPIPEELNQFCRSRIASYKVPKSYEFVSELPRNTAGKIRRSTLVEERQKAQASHV
jgi:bile acid-coenzyme A ligase